LLELAAVEKDLPVALVVVQNGDHRGRLQDPLLALVGFGFHAAWTAHEVRTALEVVVRALLLQLDRPRLHVRRVDPQRLEAIELALTARGGPDAGQVRLAFRGARCRRGEVHLAVGLTGQAGRLGGQPLRAGGRRRQHQPHRETDCFHTAAIVPDARKAVNPSSVYAPGRPLTGGSSSGPSRTALYTNPASAAPLIGATQNSQSCCSAQPPTNSAVPVLRAGFTDVFVPGMLSRWISVSARPMARPANPTGARLCVVPRITIRNMKVVTTSLTNPAASE